MRINTKVLVILSMLVGIGAVLHLVMPPLLFGVKPDMLLAMMFLGIILFPQFKYVLLLSIATGFISALTTAAPGGQIANMIDKPVTALLFLAMFLALKDRLNNTVTAPVLTAVGTMISGSIFVGIVSLLAGLPEGGFLSLLAAIVLPAAIVNTIIMVIIYPIVQSILRRMTPISTAKQN